MIAIAGIVGAVVGTPDLAAVHGERGLGALGQPHHRASARRPHLDGKDVLTGIPDLELVGRQVRRVRAPAQRPALAGAQGAARVHPGAEVVAGAVHHAAPGGGDEQGVDPLLDQGQARVRPAMAAEAQVDDPGPLASQPRDPVQRLEQGHRVAEAGPTSLVVARQVDERDVRLGRDPRGCAVGPAVAGGDVAGVRAVRTVTRRVARRRVVAERLVGSLGAQGAVDLVAAVDAAVAVRSGTGAG